MIAGSMEGLSGLQSCRVLDLPKVTDERGSLTFLEAGKAVPFEVRGFFYVYGVPAGQTRGGHAHRTLEQLLVCVSGGLDVDLDDGRERRSVRLDRPWQGLYVPPLVWASQRDMEPGTVYLVLTSAPHDEAEYIRDYGEFRKRAGRGA